MFLTLAPRDYVTYCQARGLSGHTSPCGECAFLISGLRPGTDCLLGWFSTTLLLWTLAPHDYVIYYQARGLSGHTSPRGECACFFWKTPCILKPNKFILFSRVWTLSGHTWSAANKFLVLDLSSLHPYGKLYLGYVARLRFALLGDGARCSATAHNCSMTHYSGRTMGWSARLWFTPARTSSRRRCTTGTGRSETSCGGVRPRIPMVDHMGCALRGGPAHKTKPCGA